MTSWGTVGRPAVREAILSEPDLPPDPTMLFDGMYALVQHSADRIYPLGFPLDYEPTPDQTVAAIAARRGEDPLAAMYDLMLECDAGRDADASVLQLCRWQPRRHLRDVVAPRRRFRAFPTAVPTAA